MNQRIVYNNPDGSVSIIIPTGEMPIEEVAKKDVPAGVAYKIVNAEDIPTDRTFRNAWEFEMTNPDGVGADYGVGSNLVVIEYHEGQPTKFRNEETGEIILTELGQQLEAAKAREVTDVQG